MKTQSFRILLFSLMAVTVLAGCGGLGKMEKYVEELNASAEPSPLIVRGDSIEVTITGTFPEKYFHRKVLVEATPVLVYDGGEQAFEMKGFQGENAAGNYEVIPYEQGKSFTYNDKIAYVDGMDDATLELRLKGMKGDKTQQFPPLEVGKGTRTTPYLMMSDDKVLLAEDNFERVLNFEQNAVINYLVNSSYVRGSELRDADMEALEDFMETAAEDDKITITGVGIQSYASPEGEISKNENLAQERAESAQKAVNRELKQNDMAPEDMESFYNLMPKGEDWEGFKEAMEASDIEDKNLIIRVLEMYEDKNKREEEIRNLSKTFQVIEKRILPDLRRSQIAVSYDVMGYSDEELKELAMSNPDTLTVEEALYAATLYPELNDKLTIYQSAEASYPADYRTVNNVGYILMMQNKMQEAKAKFEQANSIEENPVSTNNLGVIARLEGDREEAISMFNDAMSAGDEVKYNKGLVLIQQGEYTSAINNMSNYQTFNLALAKVLNGDATGAESTLTNSGNDSAMAHYLAAVIAARQNISADVNSQLEMAIDADPSLKEKAKNDLEFIDYWDSFTF